MSQWKDATSYSRGEAKLAEPSAWQIELAKGVSVYVTQQHVYYKGKWIMHCQAVGLDTVELKGCDTADSAKAAALNLAKTKALRIAAAFDMEST